MSQAYATQSNPTPEYVLAVFRDELRHAAALDGECDPEFSLSFDSTVAEWRIANDLLPTKLLGRSLNESWEINVSDTDWRNALAPADERTLRDVTTLISRHSKRTQLHPLNVAGTSCLPAAVFLAIKDCLAADDVDVSTIAPSTPLHEFTRHYWRTFIYRISRLSPGALPTICIKSRAHDTNLALGCLSGVFIALGILVVESAPLLLIVGGLSLLATTLHGYFIRNKPLDRATFGELRTFRDLSVCLAKQSSQFSR